MRYFIALDTNSVEANKGPLIRTFQPRLDLLQPFFSAQVGTTFQTNDPQFPVKENTSDHVMAGVRSNGMPWVIILDGCGPYADIMEIKQIGEQFVTMLLDNFIIEIETGQLKVSEVKATFIERLKALDKSLRLKYASNASLSACVLYKDKSKLTKIFAVGTGDTLVAYDDGIRIQTLVSAHNLKKNDGGMCPIPFPIPTGEDNLNWEWIVTQLQIHVTAVNPGARLILLTDGAYECLQLRKRSIALNPDVVFNRTVLSPDAIEPGESLSSLYERVRMTTRKHHDHLLSVIDPDEFIHIGDDCTLAEMIVPTRSQRKLLSKIYTRLPYENAVVQLEDVLTSARVPVQIEQFCRELIAMTKANAKQADYADHYRIINVHLNLVRQIICTNEAERMQAIKDYEVFVKNTKNAELARMMQSLLAIIPKIPELPHQLLSNQLSYQLTQYEAAKRLQQHGLLNRSHRRVLYLYAALTHQRTRMVDETTNEPWANYTVTMEEGVPTLVCDDASIEYYWEKAKNELPSKTLDRIRLDSLLSAEETLTQLLAFANLPNQLIEQYQQQRREVRVTYWKEDHQQLKESLRDQTSRLKGPIIEQHVDYALERLVKWQEDLGDYAFIDLRQLDLSNVCLNKIDFTWLKLDGSNMKNATIVDSNITGDQLCGIHGFSSIRGLDTQIIEKAQTALGEQLLKRLDMAYQQRDNVRQLVSQLDQLPNGVQSMPSMVKLSSEQLHQLAFLILASSSINILPDNHELCLILSGELNPRLNNLDAFMQLTDKQVTDALEMLLKLYGGKLPPEKINLLRCQQLNRLRTNLSTTRDLTLVDIKKRMNEISPECMEIVNKKTKQLTEVHRLSRHDWSMLRNRYEQDYIDTLMSEFSSKTVTQRAKIFANMLELIAANDTVMIDLSSHDLTGLNFTDRSLNGGKVFLTSAQVNKYLTESQRGIFYNSLYHSILEGNITQANKWFNSGTDVNVDLDGAGRTPLMAACIALQYEMAHELLKRGANVNATTKSGVPIIQTIAQGYRSSEMANLLQEYGARLDVVSVIAIGEIEALEKYLENHRVDEIVDVEAEETLMHKACYYGVVDIVEFLLARDAQLHFSNCKKQTPLHLACQEGHYAIVQRLLDFAVEIDLESKDQLMRTPLMVAVKKRYKEIAGLLVHKGAKMDSLSAIALHNLPAAKLAIKRQTMNQTDQQGMIPLHRAAQEGFVEGVRWLLEHKKHMDLNALDNQSLTPLYHACERGYLTIVNLLIEESPDQVNETFSGKMPPLVYVSVSQGHVDVVKRLIEYKADLNIKFFGRTLLHQAVCKGYLDMVNLLIKHKANLVAMDEKGNTPLHYAAQNGRQDLVDALLIGYLNSPNDQHKSPAKLAIEANHPQIAERIAILQKGSALKTDYPLSEAIVNVPLLVTSASQETLPIKQKHKELSRESILGMTHTS